MRRASEARRPDTQATTPYRLATSIKGRRVVSGMWASSGWCTIGASVPSTSIKIADCSGAARSGASTVSSEVVWDPCTPLVCPDMARMLRLAVVGTIAGVFSGLFGVGGGIVLVPLLVLWLGYGQREAAGTSLAAIAIIAGAGALFQTAYGNVHFAKGLLIGIPAVGGVVFGTWLQQRVSDRWISLGFGLLLVVSAIALVVS